ncbi:hypothetical protein F5Y06DRAFT_295963 [Hypoxylon sp. FL0890]|nr:hypothetical protein F5Y06DRAFT_295963 [Hypoxylon sp. FL0890]
MSASREIVIANGLPVGLTKLGDYYTEFDFRQGFEFVKAMIKVLLEKEIEPRSFNHKIIAAIHESTPQGPRGKYSICWLAVKFLDQLWNKIFTIGSPWHEVLSNQLKMKELNSRDDWMVYGSYITDVIIELSTNCEEIVLEFFGPKFPMAW